MLFAESHDKDTFIASSVAELLFPASTHQRTKESRAGYTKRIRELYRKTVLVPLRKCLDGPEVCKIYLSTSVSLQFCCSFKMCLVFDMLSSDACSAGHPAD